MKEVVIEIDAATGELTVEANGYVGPECAKATEWVVNSLGVKKSEKRKAEYHRVPVASKQVGTAKQGN